MDLNGILSQMGGLASIAKELGISEKQAQAGAAGLLPAILGGFKKQAQTQKAGLDGLGSMLGQMGGGGLLDEVLAPKPTDASHGNSILGQIFGSKDVSRSVAQAAAAKSGVDAGVLKKMLPLLAMAITGFMAKNALAPKSGAGKAAAGGGLGGLIGGLMGGLTGGGAGRQGGGLGGLASMLDLDGDGNPLDDILGMVTKGKR